jgi:hypothetical protein
MRIELSEPDVEKRKNLRRGNTAQFRRTHNPKEDYKNAYY